MSPQVVPVAQLDEWVSILVRFTQTELSKACIVICAHHGIEVAQINKLFIVGDAADDGCEVLVELVFCIRSGGNMSGHSR